jgi:hypothetical protein
VISWDLILIFTFSVPMAVFCGDGMFRVSPRFDAKYLEEIFRHKVFKILLSKGKITESLVNMLMLQRHSR